jgi:hypothetical protein
MEGSANGPMARFWTLASKLFHERGSLRRVTWVFRLELLARLQLARMQRSGNLSDGTGEFAFAIDYGDFNAEASPKDSKRNMLLGTTG